MQRVEGAHDPVVDSHLVLREADVARDVAHSCVEFALVRGEPAAGTSPAWAELAEQRGVASLVRRRGSSTWGVSGNEAHLGGTRRIGPARSC